MASTIRVRPAAREHSKAWRYMFACNIAPVICTTMWPVCHTLPTHTHARIQKIATGAFCNSELKPNC